MKALIFDVDGTMAETEDLHRRAFNETFAANGLNWHWDVARYRALLDTTGGKERMRQFITGFGGRPDLSDADIARLHAEKTRRYADLVAGGAVTLRPGVERLLSEARDAGIRLAIATTTSAPNVAALLDRTLGPARSGWFDVIVAGDEVPAKKPAPDIFLLALRRLGLAASECIAIEDSPNGLRSARGAGLSTVVTISAYGGQGPFDGALAVVDHLGDLGAPCQVLSGPAAPAGIVDLAQLRLWHRGAG